MHEWGNGLPAALQLPDFLGKAIQSLAELNQGSQTAAYLAAGSLFGLAV